MLLRETEDTNIYDKIQQYFESRLTIENLTIVGFEPTKVLLLSGDTKPLDGPQKDSCSVVFAYDIRSGAIKFIYQHADSTRIAHCTINTEQNLLGLVFFSESATYKAFLAEINPQHRLFSLNLERPNSIHLYFIHDIEGISAEREAHMMIVLQEETVGLYHIPQNRAGNERMVSGEPKKEEIASRFVWCQWDAQERRLFILLQVTFRLIVYQFFENAPWKIMLDWQLPPSMVECIERARKGGSYDIHVYCNALGILCVVSDTWSPHEEANDQRTIQFAFMSHGFVLRCQAPNLGQPIKLRFVDQSFLLALFSPSMVILFPLNDCLHPVHSCVRIRGEELGAAPLDTRVIIERGSKGVYWDIEMDKLTGAKITVVFNENHLVDEYVKATSLRYKMAIVHFAWFLHRKVNLQKQIFQQIIKELPRLDGVDVLKEMLVVCLYQKFLREAEHELCLAFPYSSTDLVNIFLEKVSAPSTGRRSSSSSIGSSRGEGDSVRFRFSMYPLVDMSRAVSFSNLKSQSDRVALFWTRFRDMSQRCCPLGSRQKMLQLLQRHKPSDLKSRETVINVVFGHLKTLCKNDQSRKLLGTASTFVSLAESAAAATLFTMIQTHYQKSLPLTGLPENSQQNRRYFFCLEKLRHALVETKFAAPPGAFYEHLLLYGFVCLPKEQFFQYVDCGVIPCLVEPVMLILQKIPFSKDTAQAILDIIIRLKPDDVEPVLTAWNHPLSVILLTKMRCDPRSFNLREAIETLDLNVDTYAQMESTVNDSKALLQLPPPQFLDAYLKHLETQGMSATHLRQIEQSVLLETKHFCGNQWNRFPF